MDFHPAIYNSPLGVISIHSNAGHITAITFKDDEIISAAVIPQVAETCIHQLNEYFAGNRFEFDLPLQMNGTPFQNKVWQLLQGIPFGKTVSYMELSKQYGNVRTIRAVAAANGRNPFAIVIPCHRVTGHNGDLVGYSGKLWRKRWLLDHEASKVSRQQQLFQEDTSRK